MAALVPRTRGAGLAAGLLLALAVAGPALADALVEIAKVRPLGPAQTYVWLEQNQFVKRDRFTLGADYQAVGQVASDSLGDDTALGGILRFLGNVTLGEGGPRPGSLVFRVESRHRIITDLAPEDLGPLSLGYAGLTASDYSDIGLGLPELFWKQQFLGETPVELRLGRLAPPGFFDITPFSDPLTGFMNLSMILSPTIPYPAAGSLGALGYVGLTDHIYLMAFGVDANGSFSGSGFDTIDQGEFFTGIEFGWTDQNTGGSYLMDNVHVAYWRRDKLDAAGAPATEGFSLTASRWFVEGRWGGFLRAGRSDGGSLLEKHAAVGATAHLWERNDYTGIALSWGQTFNSNTDQVSAEVFYRFQPWRNVAITPNLQLLVNPVLNPRDDKILVAGLRVRLTP